MTLEQRRAAFAWNAVQGGECKNSGEYKSLVKGAPAFVMANGLMQALAFWNSKPQNHHEQLLLHLLEWLRKQQLLEQVDFVAAIRETHGMSAQRYRQATGEALAILKWLRLYASAVRGEGDR